MEKSLHLCAASACAALILIAASPALANGVAGIDPSVLVTESLVANLPTPDGTQGQYRVIDDSDCDVNTADDGIVICLDTGSAWEVVGGSGGGSGDITDVGTCSTGACFQSETARHALLAPAVGGVMAPRAITEADISDLAHTTDTNANTICTGTTTYLDGEGNCDDISSVYAAVSHASTHSDAGADEITAENLATSCTDGQILEASLGGWVCATDDTGGSVPGSDTQVIYNDAGSFGADAGMTYDDADDELTVGEIDLAAGSFADPSLLWPLEASIYNHTTAELRFKLGSNWQIRMGSTFFLLRSGPQFSNSAGSAGAPNIIPNQADGHSGYWCDGSDTCHTSAGGVDVLSVDNDGTDTRVTITGIDRKEPQAAAPASCTFGDTYMDTSGAYCGCNLSNAWEIIHDLSDGGTPNCT